MHNIYIRARKDSTKQWTKIPFVANDDAIFTALEAWPLEWRAPDLAELEKETTQKKKDDAKLCITQLVEKQRKETIVAEVWVAREAAQKATE